MSANCALTALSTEEIAAYPGYAPSEMPAWLNKGYEDRSDHLLMLGVDPSFDGVRSDARFTDLLRRIGLT